MFNNTLRGGNMVQNILRLPEVKAHTGLSRSSIYLQVSQGTFTKQISIGKRAIGWPGREVEAIVAARIAGKHDAEIRQLVVKLEAARKAA